MSKILKDLYYGKVNAWECRPIHTEEYLTINRKIEDEKHYFMQKMPPEDRQRFEELENLYCQSSDFEHEGAFSQGFKLATILMCAVFTD